MPNHYLAHKRRNDQRVLHGTRVNDRNSFQDKLAAQVIRGLRNPYHAVVDPIPDDDVSQIAHPAKLLPATRPVLLTTADQPGATVATSLLSASYNSRNPSSSTR